MKILLTPQQERTLQDMSCMVYYDANYYYMPFFFKEEHDGIYDQLRWDDLPEGVKDFILKNHGIKLPVVDEKSTDGDPDLR